ncbi:MAG: hypothetical protein AB1798_12970, partial [Spirochaetota bacterium]
MDQQDMTADALVFIDFDGVICNSLAECYASSWLAYYTYVKGEENISVQLRQKHLFDQYRPFIRNGEDYVLLQDCIEKGIELPNQKAFDAVLKKQGRMRMAEFSGFFYKARKTLLENYRGYWLSLNRLYPDVAGIIKKAAECDAIHILSTKRPEFIIEILNANAIYWKRGRIHYPVKIGKIAYIEKILDEKPAMKAVF